MLPKISIVVPTFNSERYIVDMLDSISKQTFRSFEVIISDGGSRDKTLHIVESYDLPRLRISSRPDEGIPDALNKGFALAEGEVLCWLNSDDFYVSPYVLEDIAHHHDARLFQMAYGHSLLVDDQGFVTHELFAHLPVGGFEHAGTNLMTGSLFFSREAWLAFGGFSGKNLRSFEYEVSDFLHKNSAVKVLIPKFISALRIHQDALSQREREQMLIETRKLLSGERRWPPLVKRAERILSLGIQGNLHRAVFSKFRSSRVSKPWREVYSNFPPS